MSHRLCTEPDPCSVKHRSSTVPRTWPELWWCCLLHRTKLSTPPWLWMLWSRWSPGRPVLSRGAVSLRWPSLHFRDGKVFKSEQKWKSQTSSGSVKTNKRQNSLQVVPGGSGWWMWSWTMESTCASSGNKLEVSKNPGMLATSGWG